MSSLQDLSRFLFTSVTLTGSKVAQPIHVVSIQYSASYGKRCVSGNILPSVDHSYVTSTIHKKTIGCLRVYGYLGLRIRAYGQGLGSSLGLGIQYFRVGV